MWALASKVLDNGEGPNSARDVLASAWVADTGYLFSSRTFKSFVVVFQLRMVMNW
jgi:hypothetical protein